MLRFLPRRAALAVDAPPAPEVAASEPTVSLTPVEIYTEAARVAASVTDEPARISDRLNRGGPMPIWDVAELGGEAATLPPAEPDGWTWLPSEEIMVAIPADARTGRAAAARRRRRVGMRLGAVWVYGHLHLRPGASIADHLFGSGRRFVALTDVELADPELHEWREAPVALVNIRYLTEVDRLLTPL